MPEKTEKVQSSLTRCVGHYLGPLQLSPLSRLFKLLLAVFSKSSGLLPVGLYLVFRPPTLLCFFQRVEPNPNLNCEPVKPLFFR